MAACNDCLHVIFLLKFHSPSMLFLFIYLVEYFSNHTVLLLLLLPVRYYTMWLMLLMHNGWVGGWIDDNLPILMYAHTWLALTHSTRRVPTLHTHWWRLSASCRQPHIVIIAAEHLAANRYRPLWRHCARARGHCRIFVVCRLLLVTRSIIARLSPVTLLLVCQPAAAAAARTNTRHASSVIHCSCRRISMLCWLVQHLVYGQPFHFIDLAEVVRQLCCVTFNIRYVRTTLIWMHHHGNEYSRSDWLGDYLSYLENMESLWLE